MKKIQYILLASLAIGAGASAASLPEEAAAMAEQFLSQKMGGKTADGGSLTAAVMSTSDKTVKKTKSLKKAEFYAYNAPQGGFVLMSANGDDLRVMGYSTDAGLSFDNMPEALQEWMVAYKAATASSDFSNYSGSGGSVVEDKMGTGRSVQPQMPEIQRQSYAHGLHRHRDGSDS